MMRMKGFTTAITFSWGMMATSVLSAPLEDLVETLPLFGRPPTTMFSGYLDASEGCDLEANGPVCKIHYWLAMAETEDPTNAPIVLWLNGGPGSTSIIGFLQENGPLLMNATGGLMENPWSWTKLANFLVLEAPIGVGYSYCSRQMEGTPCQNTDKFTASASRAALVDFFSHKFPELADNDFFITGESYAGVYIPTLTKEILDHAPEINMVGIAVGDPCTDNTAQADSMDSLWYGHKYGLVDDATFDKLWNQCDLRFPTVMAQGGAHAAASYWNKHLLRLPLDRRHQAIQERFLKTGSENPECLMAYRKYMISSSHGLSQGWRNLYIDDYSLFAPVTNKEDEDMQAYMRRRDVRKALHVEEAPTTEWPESGVGFDYTKEYDACNWDGDAIVGPSMIDFYRNIAPRLQTTLVYNGDTDPCVSYEGTRTAILRVGFAELDGGSYRPWFYNQSATTLHVLAEKAPLFGPDLMAQSVGAQFGGEVVNYGHGLSFLTVHGSGHMVPQFRPQAALHMLQKLLTGEDLAPLMPTNATLQQMSAAEFSESMNAWTELAMSPPYIYDAALYRPVRSQAATMEV